MITTRRDQQEARKLQREQGMKYTTALRQVQRERQEKEQINPKSKGKLS